MRNSCQSAIQNAAVRILSTSVLVRPAAKQRADFMKTAVGQQRRNVFCPDSSKKSQYSTSNSEEPGISITRLPALCRQNPLPWRHCGKTGTQTRTRQETSPWKPGSKLPQRLNHVRGDVTKLMRGIRIPRNANHSPFSSVFFLSRK